MKKIFTGRVIGLVTAVAVVGLVILVVNQIREPATVGQLADWKVYNSEQLGLKFSYPLGYFLEEKELDEGRRSIILMADTEENRLVREGQAPGREGPVTISFNIYPKSEQKTVLAWMQENDDSNFNLSNGVYAEVTVSGKPGIAYYWDGLYQADNIAVMNRDNVVAIVATYIAPEDEIRQDFFKLMETVELY